MEQKQKRVKIFCPKCGSRDIVLYFVVPLKLKNGNELDYKNFLKEKYLLYEDDECFCKSCSHSMTFGELTGMYDK